jgi:hypothetical protein
MHRKNLVSHQAVLAMCTSAVTTLTGTCFCTAEGAEKCRRILLLHRGRLCYTVKLG